MMVCSLSCRGEHTPTDMSESTSENVAVPSPPPESREITTSNKCNTQFRASRELAIYNNSTEYGPIVRAALIQEREKYFDAIFVDSYLALGGPKQPGTYQLTPESCEHGLCIATFTDCSDINNFPNSCANLFLASGGSITIHEITSQQDTIFSATLNKITSTARKGSSTWCIEELGFEIELKLPTQTTVEVGINLGEKLTTDYTLTNCNGDEITLQSLKGKTKAIWLLAITEWCPNCPSSVEKMYQYLETADDDVEAFVILGESQQRDVPATRESCKRYQEKMQSLNIDLDLDRVLLDGNFVDLYKHLNPYFYQASNGRLSWAVPWHGILDGLELEYIYALTAPGTNQTPEQSLEQTRK